MEIPTFPLQGSFARKFAFDWVDAWNSHDLERILDHYDDDIAITSPVALQLLNNGGGVIDGKDALRNYFLRGIEAFPNRRFALIDVLWGVDTVIVYYETNVRGNKAAEVMQLNSSGRILRMWANYND